MIRDCGAAGSLANERRGSKNPLRSAALLVTGAILLSAHAGNAAFLSTSSDPFGDAFSRCAYSDFGFAPGRVDAGGRPAITIDQARALRASIRGPVLVVAFGDHPQDLPTSPDDLHLAQARLDVVRGLLNAAGIGISEASAVAGGSPGMRSDHSTAMVFFDCRPRP